MKSFWGFTYSLLIFTVTAREVASGPLDLSSEQKQAALISSPFEAGAMRDWLTDNAKHHIYVSGFIWRSDRSGLSHLAKLREARRRGVEVDIVIDHFQCLINRNVIKHLLEEGIHISLFNPPDITNLGAYLERWHSKTSVYDKQIVIETDRNVGNVYYGLDGSGKRSSISRDLVVKSREVAQQTRDFMRSAIDSSSTVSPSDFYLFNTDARKGKELLDQALVRYPDIILRRGDGWKDRFVDIENAAFFYDDPENKHREGDSTQSVFEAFRIARHGSLIIENPFIVLTPEARDELRATARANGGKILVATIAATRQDNRFVGIKWFESRALLNGMGAEIWEHRGVIQNRRRVREFLRLPRSQPTLHAKTMVVRGKIPVVGGEMRPVSRVYVKSWNLDPRSAYTNRESGMWVESEQLAQQLEAEIRENLNNELYVNVARDGVIAPNVETCENRALLWLANVLEPHL